MAQSMSDSQVLEYVKDGIRQGKEQKQLASELARKGVTKEQAMRVKQLYEQQNNVNTSQSTGTDINESRLREESMPSKPHIPWIPGTDRIRTDFCRR